MCFSPVLVQNTLSVTIYWGIDGNSQYFNFGSISLSLSLSLSLYIYIYIYIYIYEKELAGSLKSINQESQVPLHSDNYEINMLSEEVQDQALSTPSKQSNASVPTNMNTPLSHQSPRVSSIISDMKLMFNKIEEGVITFKKDIDGFLKEISSKHDKIEELDRLQTKVLSTENTIKINREHLSDRILELGTKNEGLQKQIRSQCSRTDDILKRVRKLESRITENEKNKISIQSVVAGLDESCNVIPQIPVEDRFEILSEKSNSIIFLNQMLPSPQTDVSSKIRPEEGNLFKQPESFHYRWSSTKSCNKTWCTTQSVFTKSSTDKTTRFYEQKYPTFFIF